MTNLRVKANMRATSAGATHATHAGDVVSLLGDGSVARYELVVRDAQVVHQLAQLQIPHEQRRGLLGLVAAHADLSVLGHHQAVEEPVLAHLGEGREGHKGK